jgi:hypothetical protein
LGRAGFQVRHALDLEDGDRSPVILGECAPAFAMARQALETGRHLLVACPASMAPERLALLYGSRRRAQSLFVWNERRYHPGYHFVNSLTEADATWRPRYLRLETLCLEPPASGLTRWRVLESLALLLGLTTESPLAVAATEQPNPLRNAPDLVSLRLSFPEMEAFLQLGMGEAIERRETLIGAGARKAYVDELNQSVPLRLVEDETRAPSMKQARWLSCPAPTPDELARQQCLAFLDATLKQDLVQREAGLWLKALAVLQAVGRSLEEEGALAPVTAGQEAEPRFRLIQGQPLASPPSVA